MKTRDLKIAHESQDPNMLYNKQGLLFLLQKSRMWCDSTRFKFAMRFKLKSYTKLKLASNKSLKGHNSKI